MSAAYDNSALDPQTRRELLNQTAMYAAIAAALMLFFGFARPYDSAAGSRIYIASVFATNWLLRIGGLSLLASALLCWVGLLWGLAVDALVSAIVGLGLSGIGVIWVTDGDLEGLLFVIFSLMFLNAARHSWVRFVDFSRERAKLQPSEALPDPEPAPVEGMKEAARDRLLQAKANLRRPPAEVAAQTQAVAEAPAPVDTLSSRPLEDVSNQPVPAPAPAPRVSEPVPVPPPAADTVEDGFLAELGRLDENERK